MAATDLSDLSSITTSRRAVLGAAFGGLVALGLSACAGESSDDSAAGDEVGGRTTAAAGSEGSALAGVPVEVWRDPG